MTLKDLVEPKHLDTIRTALSERAERLRARTRSPNTLTAELAKFDLAETLVTLEAIT